MLVSWIICLMFSCLQPLATGSPRREQRTPTTVRIPRQVSSSIVLSFCMFLWSFFWMWFFHGFSMVFPQNLGEFGRFGSSQAWSAAADGSCIPSPAFGRANSSQRGRSRSIRSQGHQSQTAKTEESTEIYDLLSLLWRKKLNLAHSAIGNHRDVATSR